MWGVGVRGRKGRGVERRGPRLWIFAHGRGHELSELAAEVVAVLVRLYAMALLTVFAGVRPVEVLPSGGGGGGGDRGGIRGVVGGQIRARGVPRGRSTTRRGAGRPRDVGYDTADLDEHDARSPPPTFAAARDERHSCRAETHAPPPTERIVRPAREETESREAILAPREATGEHPARESTDAQMDYEIVTTRAT